MIEKPQKADETGSTSGKKKAVDSAHHYEEVLREVNILNVDGHARDIRRETSTEVGCLLRLVVECATYREVRACYDMPGGADFMRGSRPVASRKPFSVEHFLARYFTHALVYP